MIDDYTSGSSDIDVSMQDRIQSLVDSGMINLDAIKMYDDDPNIGPLNFDELKAREPMAFERAGV